MWRLVGSENNEKPYCISKVGQRNENNDAKQPDQRSLRMTAGVIWRKSMTQRQPARKPAWRKALKQAAKARKENDKSARET